MPTFRGPEGLWRQFRPEQLATPEAFARDASTVWEWYAWRRERIAPLQPNAGHPALVALVARVPEYLLAIQNVDGLHADAGSRKLVELHGSLWRVRCVRRSSAAQSVRLGEVELRQTPRVVGDQRAPITAPTPTRWPAASSLWLRGEQDRLVPTRECRRVLAELRAEGPRAESVAYATREGPSRAERRTDHPAPVPSPLATA